MLTIDRLKYLISQQEDVNKLKSLRDSGLDSMITLFDDFTDDHKVELLPIISDRIKEL